MGRRFRDQMLSLRRIEVWNQRLLYGRRAWCSLTHTSQLTLFVLMEFMLLNSLMLQVLPCVELVNKRRRVVNRLQVCQFRTEGAS